MVDLDQWTQWVEPAGSIALAVLLLLVCAAAWLSNAFGVPGNWICLLVLLLYVWVGPTEGRLMIGWFALLIAAVLAGIGELIEFVAGAYGAKRAGANRWSLFYSMIGSLIGALVGAMIGVPVPVVGSIVSAILFGGIGGAVGAMYGEWSAGRSWRENWNIGWATFWGRTYGTLGKILAGLLILLLILVCLAT